MEEELEQLRAALRETVHECERLIRENALLREDLNSARLANEALWERVRPESVT